ncbi:MAG: hypothetical protein HC904_10545 [Blastochloris sp.]|nr:hypothetical protein [Blastochloris sp.]
MKQLSLNLIKILGLLWVLCQTAEAGRVTTDPAHTDRKMVLGVDDVLTITAEEYGGSVYTQISADDEAAVCSDGDGDVQTVTFGEGCEGKMVTVTLTLTHTYEDEEEGEVICTEGQTFTYEIYVPKLEVEEISFSGTGNQRIIDASEAIATTGNEIASPEWKKGESIQKPVCYKKGSSPTLKIKFSITPDLNSLSKSVKIKAIASQSGNNLTYQNKDLTLTGTEATLEDHTTTSTLSAIVYKGSFTATWSISTDSEASNWRTISSTTSTPLLCTWDSPIGPVTKKRLEYWCDKANGKSTVDSIVTAIGMEAVSGSHFSSAGLGGTTNNAWRILDGGNGDCRVLALLMHQSLQLIGVTGSTVVLIYPRHASWNGLEEPDHTKMSEGETGGPSGSYLGYYAPIVSAQNWNNWEGCCKIGGKYWMGGEGQSVTNAFNVLKHVSGSERATTRQRWSGAANMLSPIVEWPAGTP